MATNQERETFKIRLSRLLVFLSQTMTVITDTLQIWTEEVTFPGADMRKKYKMTVVKNVHINLPYPTEDKIQALGNVLNLVSNVLNLASFQLNF